MGTEVESFVGPVAAVPAAPAESTAGARRDPLRAPVFVAGFERSGTTLLYRLLASFTEFGEHLPDQSETDRAFETAVWFYSDPTGDLGKIYEQEWPHWKDAIPDREAFMRHVASHCELGRLRRWWEGQLNRRVFDNPGSPKWLRPPACRLSRRRDILRSFLLLYARTYNAGRVLDKCPDNYKIFRELRAILPGAKFVFIYRHPLDVYASMVRRGRLELQLEEVIPISKVSWLFVSPEEFAARWNESIRCAQEISRVAPDSLLAVKYEELTQNRESELRRICSFLDLEPASFNFSEEVAYDPSNKFPLRSATPVPNSNKLRGLLHPNDVRIITSLCARNIEGLGY
jgi:hypothetical protein